MDRVVTFGEIMLRLSPENNLRFVQADKFETAFGGAEANVAVSLANYGVDAAFVTKLPQHEIGQSAVNSLRRFGVDTSGIVRGGDRMGVYYYEKGAGKRPPKVIYDRAYSAISLAQRDDFDWDKIFDGASWFHFSGITPALSDELADICLEACKTAKKKNITVSCDLNYRQKLWSREKFSATSGKLLVYVDYVKDLLEDTRLYTDEQCAEAASDTAKRYGLKGVAVTGRYVDTNGQNELSGIFVTDGKTYFGKKYAVCDVERVGGGDGFCGGLIYALINRFEPQKAVDFALAASCLKHTVRGDFNCVSPDEVTALAFGVGDRGIER